MDIVIKEYDHTIIDSIKAESPKEYKRNTLIMKLYNGSNSSKLYIKTPKLYIKKFGNKMHLNFEGKHKENVNQFYNFLLSIEDKVTALMTEKLNALSPEISTDNLLKSCVLYPKTLDDPLSLSMNISEDCEYVGDKKRLIDGNLCTCIFKCTHLIITPTYAKLKLDVVKIKGFKVIEPKTKSDSKDYSFFEDDDELKVEYKQIRIGSDEKEKKKEEEITIPIN